MTSLTPTKPAPYRTIVDVLLILIRQEKVLLAQRQGTGYADGFWNLPSGKLEAGETITRAGCREGLEEIGILTNEADLRFVHLLHYRNHLGDARIGVFFEVQNFDGEPYNAEPHKCSRIAWWPLSRLPANTYPYTAEGLNAYTRGEHFSNVGWPLITKP
jgi:8-oxo-dGTP diphosphatase